MGESLKSNMTLRVTTRVRPNGTTIDAIDSDPPRQLSFIPEVKANEKFGHFFSRITSSQILATWSRLVVQARVQTSDKDRHLQLIYRSEIESNHINISMSSISSLFILAS